MGLLKSLEPRLGRTKGLKAIEQANKNIKDGIEAIDNMKTTIDNGINKADGCLVYIRDKLENYMSVHGLVEIVFKIILIMDIYKIFKTNKLKITDIFYMLLYSLPIPVPGREKRFEIPTLDILYMLGVLIYIVSPFDLIPDHIPIIGYTDDVFFLQRYIKMFVTWVHRWKIWTKKIGIQQTVLILGDNTIRWREEQEREQEREQEQAQ